MEVWKDIKGYESLYQVSNTGKIKSLRFGRERILKPIKRQGYLRVDLISKWFSVHRLVALHFIPNPENKPEVNHKDGDKKNNCVDNLEWNTAQENMRHAHDTGLKHGLKGEKAYQSKLSNSEVLQVRSLNLIGFTNRELARDFNISEAAMSKILRKKTYTNI